MAVTEITVFGTNHDGIRIYTEEALSICDRQGIDYDGPALLPRVHRTHVIDYFNLEHHTHEISKELPTWFKRIEFRKEERGAIISAVDRDPEEHGYDIAFCRKLRIRNDKSAAAILEIKPKNGVFFRVSIEKEDIPEASGNAPYSYDPNQEHVTDMLSADED